MHRVWTGRVGPRAAARDAGAGSLFLQCLCWQPIGSPCAVHRCVLFCVRTSTRVFCVCVWMCILVPARLRVCTGNVHAQQPPGALKDGRPHLPCPHEAGMAHRPSCVVPLEVAPDGLSADQRTPVSLFVFVPAVFYCFVISASLGLRVSDPLDLRYHGAACPPPPFTCVGSACPTTPWCAAASGVLTSPLPWSLQRALVWCVPLVAMLRPCVYARLCMPSTLQRGPCRTHCELLFPALCCACTFFRGT
jgi:hypothetical protein